MVYIPTTNNIIPGFNSPTGGQVTPSSSFVGPTPIVGPVKTTQPTPNSPQNTPASPTPQTFNFLNESVDANPLTGQVYGTRPNPPASPQIVASAKPAVDDVTNKQAATNGLIQSVGQQAQGNAIANATPTPPPTPEDPNKKTSDTLDEINKTLSGSTSTTGESAGEQAVGMTQKDITAKQDAEFSNLQTQTAQLMNGTFPLTSDQLAQVNAMQSQYNQLKAQQDLANQNYTAGITNLGIANGQQRYAPAIALGNIQNAVSAGIQKVADIENKATQALAQLKSGFQSDNYDMINKSYDALKGYLDDKSKTITDINNQVQQQVTEQLAVHKQQVDEQQAADKVEYDHQQAAVKFALDNNITTPFYMVGNTVFNTGTGEQVDLPTYQKLTGQTVGASPDDTDFSNIQQAQPSKYNKDNVFGDANSGYFYLDPHTGEKTQLTSPVDQKLTPTEAAVLGVPYGTTQSQAAGATPKATLTGTEKYDLEVKLSSEFEGYAKDAKTALQNSSIVDNAYNEALKAIQSGNSTNAQSQAVVSAFNKITDPHSVVRESEYARTPEGQSLFDKLDGQIQQYLYGGAGLTADGLKNLKDTADALTQGYEDSIVDYAQRSKYQADRYGLDLKAILTPDALDLVNQANDPGKALTKYLTEHPEIASPEKVEAIEKEHPEYTPEDIANILGVPGFNNVASDTNTAQGSTFAGPTKTSDLQQRNLSFAPDVPIGKVTIGAGAAVKNNNPGNLRNKDGSWMQFSTPEEGFKGLLGYIERAKNGDSQIYNANQSLYTFFSKYAPAADSNNPKSYAETVAKALGISPETPIGKIDTLAFAKQIAKHESNTNIA